MWPLLVVLLDPVSADLSDLIQVSENVHIQHFCAEGSVETFNVGILGPIPIGSKHRLENRGKIPLELIEVQVGEYLEEDDIERFGDTYGRD